jgi:hypothetical protein
MNALLQDLRHGFRRLARSPVFAGLLVLSLGLGIGVNVALFRLLDATVLTSRPIRSGADLVEAVRGEGGGFLAAAGLRHGGVRLPRLIADRSGCVRVGVVGIHATVSFRMARRSGEIGVRVGLGDAGGEPCA